MVCREPRDAPARCLVQRIVSGPHVGPLGLAIGRRDHLGREHRRLRCQRHIRAVGMPALIAAQGFEAMLVRSHDRSIGLLVADRHRLLLGVRRQELDIPEAIGECHLRLCRQALRGKHQDRVVVEGLLHGLPGERVHPGKVEAGDDGAQRGIDRRNLWLHGIPRSPAACGWITRESRWDASRVDSVAPRSTAGWSECRRRRP